MTTLAILGVTTLVLSLVGYFAWARANGTASIQLFRCPDCGQKLRYAANRAGRRGVCPRCRANWVLPTEPTSVETNQTTATYILAGRRLVRRTA